VKRTAAAVLTVLLGVLMTASPAHAATNHVVTLATNGPQPGNVTIAVGDTVTFKAADGNTFHVRRTSGSWTFTATVTTAKPATTKAFTAAGTYGYSSTFDTILGESPPASGSVVVPASSPSPTAKPSTTPKPSTSASPRPSASGSPSPTAAPTQSGVAVPPPITGGVVPTPSPTPAPNGPAPQFPTTPDQTSSPTSAPAANVQYADPSGLVQKSRHGYGLPTLLAVVGIVGVATLLVRLLLAQPEARPDL
jgi:plastocyanin